MSDKKPSFFGSNLSKIFVSVIVIAIVAIVATLFGCNEASAQTMMDDSCHPVYDLSMAQAAAEAIPGGDGVIVAGMGASYHAQNYENISLGDFSCSGYVAGGIKFNVTEVVKANISAAVPVQGEGNILLLGGVSVIIK